MPKKSTTWWDMARSGGSSVIGMLKKLPISVEKNRGVGTDAETLIGIAHRSQDEHDDEKADQDGKEAGRQRQIVHMAHLLVLPLDRTTHGRNLLFRTKACLGDLFHRFKQVATSVRDRRHTRGIEPTSILQLVPHVEAEEIGRALSVISACHFLGRVDNVGKREAVLRGECLHVIEGVLRVGVRVVWHYGNRANPDRA